MRYIALFLFAILAGGCAEDMILRKADGDKIIFRQDKNVRITAIRDRKEVWDFSLTNASLSGDILVKDITNDGDVDIVFTVIKEKSKNTYIFSRSYETGKYILGGVISSSGTSRVQTKNWDRSYPGEEIKIKDDGKIVYYRWVEDNFRQYEFIPDSIVDPAQPSIGG